MHASLTPGWGLWIEPLTVTAVGVAVITALAALLARSVRTPVWQRTVWQAATLGLLALLVVELSGGASALVALARAAVRGPQGENELANRGLGTGGGELGTGGGGLSTADGGRGTADRGPPLRVEEGPPRGAEHSTSAHVARAGVPVRPTDATIDAARASADAGAMPLLEEESTTLAWSGAESTVHGEPPFWRTMPYGLVHEGEPAVPAAPPDMVAATTSVGRSGGTASSVNGTLPPSSLAERLPANAPGPPWLHHPLWPGVVWVLGVVLFGARFAWSRLLLIRFRRRHAVVREAALVERVGALARHLGVRRPVTVLEAAGLPAPVAFGCLRPTLALPATFSRDFDGREQEAVIVHELAHLAARDPAWQAMADVACAVLWWHPLAWWSRRRLRSAGETAADEASRLLPDGPDLLASCLIQLGRRLAGARPSPGWLSMGGPGFRSGLGRRVERLLRRSDGPWRSPRRGPLALAQATLPATLVVVAVLSTAWAHPRATLTEGGTPMNVVRSSWRRSLAAAAVVALLTPISGDTLAQEERGKEVPALFTEEGRAEETRRERESPEARQRERGQREGGEREALAHQVEVLRLAAHALREAERGDAVEMVERAIRAREVTLEGRRDDEAGMIRERAPGPGDLAETLGVAANLWREFGSPEKAEAVADLAERLRAPRDREPEGPRRDRQPQEREQRVRAELADRERLELARRLRELMAAHGQAREAGRHEEAERVLREVDEIKRHFQQRPDRDAPRPEPREEMERRMQHVRVAVDNLHAAGLHEQAEQLAREMERMLRGPRRPDEPRPGVGRPPRGEGPPPERLEGALRELHEAVRHLHARMDEMTRNMEREIQAIRRDMEKTARELDEDDDEDDQEADDDEDDDEDEDDEDGEEDDDSP